MAGGATIGVGTQLLRERVAIHLIVRLAQRAYHVLSPNTLGREREWRVRAVRWTLVDLAVAAVLRGTDARLFWPRVSLDALDVAVWSLAVPPRADTYTAAALVGIPLALETGYRDGLPKASIVPVATTTAAFAFRRLHGRAGVPSVALWQLMAAIMGALLRRQEEREFRGKQRDEEARIRARTAEAELSGRNLAIAFADGSTVLDDLQRAILLLEPAGVRAARVLRGLMAEHREDLARRTSSSSASYLRTVVAEFERARRVTEAELTRWVEFMISPPSAGVVVLTADQRRQLLHALLELDPVGEVRVEVGRQGEGGRPGGTVMLDIGGRRIELPAGRRSGSWRFEMAPVALLAAAMTALLMLNPNAHEVPVAVGLPAAFGYLAAAAWSERKLRAHSEDAYTAVLLVSLLLVLVHIVVATRAMRRPFSGAGVARYPVTSILAAYGLLLGHHFDLLTRPSRRLALVVTVLASGVGFFLAPPPRQPFTFAADLTGFVVCTGCAAAAARAVARQSEDVVASLEAAGARAVVEAVERGRRIELGFARRCVEAGRALASTAPPGVFTSESLRRLSAAEARLAELEDR